MVGLLSGNMCWPANVLCIDSGDSDAIGRRLDLILDQSAFHHVVICNIHAASIETL